ncbi:MAG: DNA methylase [Deltaproteobacteria bacterium]|nr:MAG: DNA methylase [Deltaproteobacteria bacterium]
MKPERLSDLEKIIADQRYYFYEIGKALKEIRDKRLYKIALFNNFEEYTKNRWDMSRSQAYRLINAFTVVNNLSPIGDKFPENEAQARLLTQFNKDKQCKIWRDFLKTGVEVTALNLRKFISIKTKKQETVPDDQTNLISDNYMETVNGMLEQIRAAQNDGWQTTSRQAALMWNRVMYEKILSDTASQTGGLNGN